MTRDESILEQLPPEKLLDTRKTRVITPAIEMMEEVATVELYLEHERKNRDRPGIIRYITDRIDAICEESEENSPGQIQEQERRDAVPVDPDESFSPISPPEDLLAYIYDLGTESDEEVDSGPDTPAWDEL